MNGTALLYTAIAAAANLLGAAAVVARNRWSVRALENMVALSAGFMVSVALLDLVPDSIRVHGESAALIILLGYLLVHLTQHTLAPHFHFGEEHHHVTKLVSFSALAGLILHTFVDGVAIASGFGVSTALGLLVFFAILLHKLPEGLAISSLFLASGESRRAAFAAVARLRTKSAHVTSGADAVEEREDALENRESGKNGNHHCSSKHSPPQLRRVDATSSEILRSALIWSGRGGAG